MRTRLDWGEKLASRHIRYLARKRPSEPETGSPAASITTSAAFGAPWPIARDAAHGITTFPYTIEGQRELKFLPRFPTSYGEAMEVLKQWMPADQAGHPLTKENVTNDGDRDVKEEILSSACTYADGQYATMVRDTQWGNKSLTFKVNPNPQLFAGEGRITVGGRQLQVIDRWLREHPEFGGVFVDSLGSNWPALYNFRQDQFADARFPLTFDSEGRVALHNTTSVYEFIDTLRTLLRQSNRLVIGNGVYTYVSKGGEVSKHLEAIKFDGKANEFAKVNAPPEHYRGAGTKLGRFFLTALLDAATCEQGVKAPVGVSQDVRVMMGRKTYSYINYKWDDAAQIEEFVNKALSYGIFASSTTDFATGVKYEDNPAGYLRGKTLLDWYMPLVRTLSQAGWEPVRGASIEGKSIVGERFGNGQAIYFTLYNDSDVPQHATLTIDLPALGVGPTDKPVLQEVGHASKLEVNDSGNSASLTVPAQRVLVIRLTHGGNTLIGRRP